MIDSSNDLLGGCTAIVSAESLLKRHRLPALGSTGVIHDFQGRLRTIRGPGLQEREAALQAAAAAAAAGGGFRKTKALIVQQWDVVFTLKINE